MAILRSRELDSGYTSEVDTVDEPTWHRTLQEFDDANIYQTWSYATVVSGRRNMSHLILRKDGEIVAIAQVRIARLPIIKVGIAYVMWGPMWRRSGSKDNEEVFRQAIRALRNEFVSKRGLALRMFPFIFSDDSSCFLRILFEEGFKSLAHEAPGRTILMDLRPSLKDLRDGMGRNWKRNLKSVENSELEIVEGSDEGSFEKVIAIYKEMVSRKKFLEPNDINQFKSMQAQLPDNLKMRIMLCGSGGDVTAALVWSEIGKTPFELFAATSNTGVKRRGSYLLRWRLIERLKQSAFALYNLNGINPERNPGTYYFKRELAGKNGRDVYYLGRFDSHASFFSHLCVQSGDLLRWSHRSLREFVNSVRGGKARPSFVR